MIYARDYRKERAALQEWVLGRYWTHFVTLAVNDAAAMRYRPDRKPRTPIDEPGNVLLRDRLRMWDAKMNRLLVGPKWQRRPDERMQWFFIPESIGTNPHLHGYVQILPDQVERFEKSVEPLWRHLVSKGTVDVQRFNGRKARSGYNFKQLTHVENYENFVHSMELINAHA